MRLDSTAEREVLSRGFTIVRDAVDRERSADLRERLAGLIEQQRAEESERTRVDRDMVHNPFLSDSTFLEVLEIPLLVAAIDTFLDDTGIIYAYTTSSMPTGGTNYSHRVHVDSPRVIPGYLTNLGIVLALDDFTDDNGATYYLPGSFERRDTPTEAEFFADAERVYPRRGDLIVFNARTFHLGGQNTTDEDRHAVTINCCRAYMRQRFDYPRMIDAETEARLSETQRRLLGFNVRVPASLDEYYLPEDQRLYKAGQG